MLRIAPLPGNWETHGAYSLIQAAADGRLDLRRRDWPLVKSSAPKLVRYQGQDSFADLSWPRALLTEQAAFKSVVIAKIASWALAHGVLKDDGDLQGALGTKYLAWTGELRRTLEILGIERVAKPVGTLEAYVTAKYGNRDGAKERAE